MPGPPKKLFAIKKAEGNPGHQVLNEGPKWDGKFGPPPKWIGKEGRKMWQRMVPLLESKGLQSSAYYANLAGFCKNWDRMVTAEIIREEKGDTFEILREAGTNDDGTPKFVCTYVAQRPEVAIALKSWDRIKGFGALFGLSPADAQRVVIPTRRRGTMRQELAG